LHAIEPGGSGDLPARILCDAQAMEWLLIGGAIAIVIGIPLRVLGRWLQRKGRNLERNPEDRSG
jgi:hypothetical protein